MMTPSGRRLGGIRSIHDDRDHSARAKVAMPVQLPERVDLRDAMPPIWNQGSIGSCEAHGVGRALAAMYPGFMPSRLAMYYAARSIEGTISTDVGVQTRDMMKVVAVGAIPEDAWPYDPSKFAEAPPAMDPVFRIGSYSRLRGRNDILGWLALGFPVPFAIDLPESFEGLEIVPTGIITPRADELTIGWHCMCAVGYDLAADRLIIANSWGADWGDAGHCHMPIDYIVGTHGDDAWALHTISDSRTSSGPSFGGVPIQGEYQKES